MSVLSTPRPRVVKSDVLVVNSKVRVVNSDVSVVNSDVRVVNSAILVVNYNVGGVVAHTLTDKPLRDRRALGGPKWL